jgi:hypothetical protein
MIHFRISGAFPCPWEDFYSLDRAAAPHITMMTRANADEDGFPDSGPSDDGWLDIVVDVPFIDEDVARLAIADALHIANPEDIHIEQAGWCQSV